MAQFEMKINGRIVKSDLELDRVDGAFVYFVGGSWCNADTGQVNLVGDGYINISGDPTSPKAERKTIEKVFAPQALKVEGLYAELEVIPHNDNVIIVTIEGTEDEIKDITAKEMIGGIYLSGGQQSLGQGTVISVKSSRSISFSNIVAKNMTVVGNIFEQLGQIGPKVTVKVPTGTPISVSEIHESVTIGDILGDIALTLDSNDDATVGKVKNCVVVVNGSGGLDINQIEGDFKITVNGSGDTDINNVNGTVVALIKGRGGIDIEDGEASIFDVKNTASGDFSFGGNAKNPKIVLSGMGGIEIANAYGDLQISNDGSGDIDISSFEGGKLAATLNGRGGISIENGHSDITLITNSGSGDFDFDGTARDSRLSLTGRGGIDITTINGDIEIDSSGSGEIDVEDGKVGNLKVESSGRGGVTLGVKAIDATLKSTGSGDIDVTFVKNKPTMIQRGRGDITVSNWDD